MLQVRELLHSVFTYFNHEADASCVSLFLSVSAPPAFTHADLSNATSMRH